jgi:hypothetical protein
MQITFISFDRALLTVLFFGIALVLYAWKVRPYLHNRPEFKGFYDDADTRWQRAWIWCRQRWDIVAAAIIALAPIIWNGALDAIIAASLLLADLLPALSGLDLSGLVMPAWLKTTIQVGGAIVPVIRSRTMKKDDE